MSAHDDPRIASADQALVLSRLPKLSDPLDLALLGPLSTRRQLNDLVGRPFEFSVARWSDRGLLVMFDTDDDLFDTACALRHLDEMDGVTLEIVSVVDG